MSRGEHGGSSTPRASLPLDNVVYPPLLRVHSLVVVFSRIVVAHCAYCFARRSLRRTTLICFT
jgi:hypothetical protein